MARKQGKRASYDRILIVSEGSKTEPLYFGEIRSFYKLNTAHVRVQPGALGTQPLQVVEYAEQLFRMGDSHKGIQPRAFEQVYALFDRDDHPTFHAALASAEALNGKLKNDLGVVVKIEAIPSVPCFELWLLLHFEDIHAPLHRAEVQQRLRQHLPGYAKGQAGQFAATRLHIDLATQRATQLALQHTAHDGRPFTGIHGLVSLLMKMKPR